MARIDPSQPLPDQILTSEDEQNEVGPADVFYDVETDRMFTIEDLAPNTEQVELNYYWPDETNSLSIDEFRSRITERQYGRVARDLEVHANDTFKEFVIAAYDTLIENHDIDEEFEPLGVTFRDLRYMLFVHYGPDIRESSP